MQNPSVEIAKYEEKRKAALARLDVLKADEERIKTKTAQTTALVKECETKIDELTAAASAAPPADKKEKAKS